ncbi:MAG: response regulator transcription factor [Bacteroidia bacterium]|nr:response regulator transcription factor [Bacteroidia bacterium]
MTNTSLPPIHVLLVDDQPIFLDTLKLFLNEEGSKPERERIIQVVATASDGAEAINIVAAQEIRIDVVIMDISMPRGMGGIEATTELVKRFPHIPVLMLTADENGATIAQLLDIGAAGYILKGNTSGAREVVMGIEAVYGQATYYGTDVMQYYVEHVRNQRNAPSMPQLTPQETRILRLIVDGFTSKEIGQRLYIESATVEVHRRNLMQKLKVTNTASLVREAIRMGLIEL